MRNPNSQRFAVVFAGLIALVLFAGCSSGPKASTTAEPASPSEPATASTQPTTSAEGAHELVTITDKGFRPVSVTVKVGTRVVWTNEGKEVHDVTLGATGPSSGGIKPGGTASHVFDEPGMFDYHDSLHPTLSGTVTVQ